MPGALRGLVGADAVELMATAPKMRFQIAVDFAEQLFEPRLWIDTRIDHDISAKSNGRGLLQKAERKSRGECEAVLPMRAAPREADIDALFKRGPAWDDRKVDRRGEDRRRVAGRFLRH